MSALAHLVIAGRDTALWLSAVTLARALAWKKDFAQAIATQKQALALVGDGEEAEAYTQRSLITQTWECRLDRFPTDADGGPSIRLWHGPVQSISSVRYVDTLGATQTLSGALYTTDLGLEPGFVLPAVDTSWPDTLECANAVTVTFVAGYGDAASDVPAPDSNAIVFIACFEYSYDSIAVEKPARSIHPPGLSRVVSK